ncbi:MAG: sterol desaturase family protein [Paracoccaceae bacterium]
MENLRNMLVDIFSLFPQNFGLAIVTNLFLAAAVYFVFWKLLARRLQNWRIQINRRADSRQLRRELKNSLYVLTVGATLSCIVTYFGTQGYTRIYTDLSAQSLWVTLIGFPVLLVIDDAWFYWVHRALHHPAIYPYVHHEHHKSLDVNPLTSLSFHWLEPLLLTLWIIPVSMVLPVYAPVLGVLQIYGFLDNIKSHLGYEIFPARLNKSPLRFVTSSTYHNLHHTKFKGNYGVHFRFWDRLMGTELPQYETVYDEVQARKANRHAES